MFSIFSVRCLQFVFRLCHHAFRAVSVERTEQLASAWLALEVIIAIYSEYDYERSAVRRQVCYSFSAICLYDSPTSLFGYGHY